MKKYVYILCRDHIDRDYEPAEIIFRVSNNIEDILDSISTEEQYYDTKIMVLETGVTVDYCESIYYHTAKCALYIKEYPLAVFRDDETEINHVYECLLKWENERAAYLSAKKIENEVKREKEREEKERKEYERLKKKFEKN